MKVLFLDIDGVLNRDGTKEKFLGYTGLDKKLVDRFLTWLKPDVNVVLSSTWRTDERFVHHLVDAHIPLYSHTPNLGGIDRGVEIKLWLAEHPEVKQWAVVDDCQMTWVGYRLVLTSPKRGLEDKHLIRINNILNAQTSS